MRRKQVSLQICMWRKCFDIETLAVTFEFYELMGGKKQFVPNEPSARAERRPGLYICESSSLYFLHNYSYIQLIAVESLFYFKITQNMPFILQPMHFDKMHSLPWHLFIMFDNQYLNLPNFINVQSSNFNLIT